MHDKDVVSLRERLKKNSLLYFLAGYARSLAHHGNLLLHSLGFIFTNKTTVDGMPVPPPRLRYRVHGNLRRKSFLAAGSQIYQEVLGILKFHEVEVSHKRNVLDFGCGCARLLGQFFQDNAIGKFTGTDIDGDAIAWARINYPNRARWDVNKSRPPLTYSAQTFSVVFAVSVFTHFDEELQLEWLQELHRVLSPNGVLICSVHGRPVWGQAALSSQDLRDTMAGKGFYFLRSNLGVRNLAGLPKFYQTAFHSEEYVRNHWGSYFHIIDYIDGAIGNHQTAVVLRKKEIS